MDEYLISKAGLTELLNRYDKNELQEVYRLCLEDINTISKRNKTVNQKD